MKKLLFAAFTSALLVSACATAPEVDGPKEESAELYFPSTPAVTHTDSYHGTPVDDPYRWLEITEQPAVEAWLEEQSAFTDQVFAEISSHHEFKRRLTQLWNYPRASIPKRYGNSYFYENNNGLQDQADIYVREVGAATSRRLLDVNQLSTDGSIAVAYTSVSPNGRYLGYAVSQAGSDWVEWRIRDVQSGNDFEDVIKGVKFTQLSWLPNESGFYYSRYPDNPSGEPDDAQPVAIYFHRLGTAQRNDRRVYDLSRFSAVNPYPSVTQDGRYLLATLAEGYAANAIHILDLTTTGARWQPLLNRWDGLYEFIGSDANLLFFRTTADAPNGRVIAVDIHKPAAEHWQVLIDETESVIRDVHYIGGRFIVHSLENAHSRLAIYNAYGRFEQTIDLPGMGSITDISGSPNRLEMFFSYHSFIQPPTTYRYDVASAELSPLDSFQPSARLDHLITEQVHYPSSDGQSISMFIVRHRDVQPGSGTAPTLMYGYGGFNIALTPSFNPAWVAWVERGGILAVPNLRGGGEYGQRWHQQGTGKHKQQVFDDFIYAAEYLIEHGYTQPERLAISGRSNGGLLVGAVITQRPQLIAAALPDVGVFDMLRYHTSSANARAWQSEFGIANEPQDFTHLLAYSPVHNVNEGECYPATFISTDASDDRVAPWHSYKFAATLQRAQGCQNPIALRVEDRAGHGAGSPIWMQIDLAAQQLGFVLKAFGMDQLQSIPRSTNLGPLP